jgi:2-polyprenyl-3-methyl-5-hydroxy-6-metoxy-1,4-benzoquinol methylase
MQDFWEKKHSESAGYWISDTNNAKYILDIHRLQDPKNLRILDIGIGQGHIVRYLVGLGNDVACCDISLTALNGVKDIAKTYHTRDINSIPPVDLCICNLVFQHCTDDECMRIINGVKLSDTGRFTFQFAFLRDGEEPTQVVKTNIENKTHYFRSKEDMLKIVSMTNKKVVDIHPDIHHHGDENFSWSIMVVSNK